MVQMNCIDMNAWYSRVDKPDKPDCVVFDLDPPESRNGFVQAIRVAHLVREALERLELQSYVKTSGADGIRPGADYAPLLVPGGLRARRARVAGPRSGHPGLVTTSGSNGSAAVCWSTTVRTGTERRRLCLLGAAGSREPRCRRRCAGRSSARSAAARLRDARGAGAARAHGDLFEPVLRGGQALGPALRSLRA